jgi:hypothetical protein
MKLLAWIACAWLNRYGAAFVAVCSGASHWSPVADGDVR